MKLCRDNRDGSYSTQATRRRILDLVANQLQQLGFRRMQARSLKPKHINALIKLWKEQNISVGTFKNRMSALRWLAKKINKPGIIPRNNKDLEIGNRSYVGEKSNSWQLKEKQLARITDEYTKLSLRLQASFGLRREESIKFRPSYAIRGDHIKLKASWTKGGRARSVPIRTEEQRQLLEEVGKLARGGALIPPNKKYDEQLHRYEQQVRKASIKNPHGLRHAYAERRYFELTDWKSPLAGGPASKSLGSEQRALDKGARETISQELGHSREQISATYLGR